MQNFQPKLALEWMSPPAPIDPGYGRFDRSAYFKNYRNEYISRMNVPSNDYGIQTNIYTPIPDNSNNRYLNLPESQFSMIDRGRQQEIDNFYTLSQLHRDQYRDHTDSLHPLEYFKSSEYPYQCPTDPTSQYIKCPTQYVKYRQPIVFPLTLERDIPMPYLPHRALTGIYNKSSDISYKR